MGDPIASNRLTVENAIFSHSGETARGDFSTFRKKRQGRGTEDKGGIKDERAARESGGRRRSIVATARARFAKNVKRFHIANARRARGAELIRRYTKASP